MLKLLADNASSFNIEAIMCFIWLGIFIVAIIVELATAELVSVWFVFASIITMILSFIPGIPYWVEVIVFVVISLIQIIFLRKFLKKLFKKEPFKSNVDSLIGKRVLVTKDITKDELGEIKFKGVVWSAFSNEDKISKGEYVIIESVDGNRLEVRKEN